MRRKPLRKNSDMSAFSKILTLCFNIASSTQLPPDNLIVDLLLEIADQAITHHEILTIHINNLFKGNNYD